MHGGHCDDETKQVVNNCVQKPISEGSSWQMFNTLQLIVDVQLRCHLNEPKHVDAAYKSV